MDIMSKAPLSHRFHFNTICAGVLRIIQKPAEFSKLYPFLEHKLFFQEDDSEQANHLRSVLEASKLYYEENTKNIQSMNLKSIQNRILALHTDKDKGQSINGQLQYWMQDADIKSRMEHDNTFDTLVNYLKATQFAKESQELYKNYQSGKIPEAIKIMENIVGKLNKIGEALSDDIDLTPEGVWKFLESNKGQSKIVSDRLFLGDNTAIDKALGGFEKQTLNVFIAPTGGGKSVMCHHLLRRAISQEMRVHLFCVEDRYKSFLYKFLAAQTGIDMKRIKLMDDLQEQEKNILKKAIQNMHKYLKVQFIYGHSVDTVHQLSLEYDTECRSKGQEVPVIHIIDYTGHIASFSRGDKTHEKMRNAYASRKDFALKHNKICFDFAQINRDGNKRLREDHLITHADLAGAYDLSQVCDNIISINRNNSDIQNQTATLHISKARDGETGKFLVKTEFGKSRYNMEISETEQNNILLEAAPKNTNVTQLRTGLTPIL